MKFYDEMTNYYNHIFPLGKVKEAWVLEQLEKYKVKSLLDIGCATGTLAASMIKHLNTVDGFDLDGPMVELANQTYNHEGLRLQEGNMLDIDQLYEGQFFDAVTCFGNTLVHLPGEDVKSVFRQIKGHLKEGGVFIGQIVNYDYIYQADVKALPLIDNDVVRFDRYYDWTDRTRLDFKTKLLIKQEGITYENRISLFPLYKAFLDKGLKEAGFDKVSYYKNYKGDVYDGNHLPLIFLAQ